MFCANTYFTFFNALFFKRSNQKQFGREIVSEREQKTADENDINNDDDNDNLIWRTTDIYTQKNENALNASNVSLFLHFLVIRM